MGSFHGNVLNIKNKMASLFKFLRLARYRWPWAPRPDGGSTLNAAQASRRPSGSLVPAARAGDVHRDTRNPTSEIRNPLPDILKVKEHCAPRLRPSPGLILGTTQKSADRVRAARNVL